MKRAKSHKKCLTHSKYSKPCFIHILIKVMFSPRAIRFVFSYNWIEWLSVNRIYINKHLDFEVFLCSYSSSFEDRLGHHKGHSRGQEGHEELTSCHLRSIFTLSLRLSFSLDNLGPIKSNQAEGEVDKEGVDVGHIGQIWRLNSNDRKSKRNM